MSVELVSPGFVHRLVSRIATARTEALAGFENMPPPGAPDESRYWEGVLEANAALVLRCLDTTRLAPGFAVRYRFYENRNGELRIRPFVTREGTDVSSVKRVLDWHLPPDAQRRSGLLPHDQDASILYEHFSFPRSAEGVFEYWFAMQEIWASSQWAHARVVCDASELSQLSSGEGWRTERSVDQCAPAVVAGEAAVSHLAVLVYSPIGHESVTLEQIEIPADQSIRYGEPLVVATGPKGYVL